MFSFDDFWFDVFIKARLASVVRIKVLRYIADRRDWRIKSFSFDST
jgi:predicted DNA-binding ribbon-helix-helix protein